MSAYKPQRGDRVRVVIEGEVAFMRPSGGFWVADNYIIPSAAHVVSVEKIADPLPTTLGSVIRNRHSGAVWYLGHRGEWEPVNRSISGGDVTGVGVPENYYVVFDAGEVAS